MGILNTWRPRVFLLDTFIGQSSKETDLSATAALKIPNNKRFQVHLGRAQDILKKYPENYFNSVVCDPPYHLTNGGTKGFMGKEWDGGDVAFRPEFWIEVLRVLKPGGHLLAFSGSRTYHRMACGIEDAGFEIRDQIMWLYGSGFPKSHNLKGEWQGWGSALKPAHEPIVVARKPIIGTIVENVLNHGTGAINIDGCRVETEAGGRPAREVAAMRDDVAYAGNALAGRVDGSLQSSKAVGSTEIGRWPANVIHDGSEEVINRFPKEQGKSVSAARFFYCAKANKKDRDDGLEDFAGKEKYRDFGIKNRVENGRVTNDRKNDQSTKAKNTHPTVKPTDLMRYLCRLVTQPDGLILDPFMGSGSTGKAAILEGFRFVGIDMVPEYVEIARARINKSMKKFLSDPHLPNNQ